MMSGFGFNFYLVSLNGRGLQKTICGILVIGGNPDAIYLQETQCNRRKILLIGLERYYLLLNKDTKIGVQMLRKYLKKLNYMKNTYIKYLRP